MSSYVPEMTGNVKKYSRRIPTCSSNSRGLYQPNGLCDVCRAKRHHGRSGRSSRQKRTERRLLERANAKAKTPQSNSYTDESYALTRNQPSSTGRIVKATGRSGWRPPCLYRIESVIIGDSQVRLSSKYKFLILY